MNQISKSCSKDALFIIYEFINFIFSKESDKYIAYEKKPKYNINHMENIYSSYNKSMEEFLLFLKSNEDIKEKAKEYLIIQNKMENIKKDLECKVNFNFIFQKNKYSVDIYQNKLENNFSFSIYLANEKYYNHKSKNIMASFYNSGQFACINDSFISLLSNFKPFYKTVEKSIKTIKDNNFIYSQELTYKSLNRFNDWKIFLTCPDKLNEKYIYNDLDNSAEYYSNDSYEMIVHKDQTMFFVHILDKESGELKIFDCSHLKDNELLHLNPEYFLSNFNNESQYLSFSSIKGLNIKCNLSFFIKEHLNLLNYGLK